MASTTGRNFPSRCGAMPYLFTIILFFVFTTGASAFGAGATSSDDCKWRHGDIENALLGLTLAKTAGGTAFTRMDVKRVYFGNWMRDYSQIMDVPFLRVVGPNILRTLVALFAFMTFGYGTGEFEVTDPRLSVYRPEEHIDNPKHYAKNVDAKKYDSRLRGVVDEDLELFPDDRTGMKGYIANERIGITTTAGYVKKALGRCIKLGRQHARKKNIKDFDDALRHLGAALHALEDFPAHSNYIELCLRELGERGVFPHVGTATEVEVRSNQVFPLVTGTFGSVHFLSSVVGGDPKNPNPSEIQQLEEQITSALELDGEHGGEVKLLREHFASLPQGLLNEASIQNLDLLEERSKAKQEEVKTRAEDGEPVDLQAKDLYDQIFPYLEMHDRVVREIVYGMEEVPTHAATYEKIQESLAVVTFCLIAPHILPVLQQARTELAESANDLIAISSERETEVFSDPYCSDPVHSVISKDNAANVLSEPAGRIAVEIVRFVVPLIMRAWDEPDLEMDPLIEYILGVFHHPVCRDERKHRGQATMYGIVRDWWTLKTDDEKDELRGCLSMDGIRENKNYNGHDSGHGSLNPVAGRGIKPGDATGTIFTMRKPSDEEEEDAKVAEVIVERAPDPSMEGAAMAGAAAAAAVGLGTPIQGSLDGGKSHRRKRDRDSKNLSHRDREDRGSRSPEKREHRRRRHHDEAGLDREPPLDDGYQNKDSRRKHRSGDPRSSLNELGERERHHRHRDEQGDRGPTAPIDEKPKDGTKSRFSQMFTSGITYLGFGGAAAPAEQPRDSRDYRDQGLSPSNPKVNGSADRVRHSKNTPSEERTRRHRHRHEGDRIAGESPSRHRSSRRRELSKSDEEVPPQDRGDIPPPTETGPEVPTPFDVPETPEEAPAIAPVAALEGDAGIESEGRPSRRRSSRRKEGHRSSRREGGDPPPIPEEGSREGSGYFRPSHPEQELRGSKSKANKILGMDSPEPNGESLRKSRTRRHTDLDVSEKRRQEDAIPSRGGFLGRIAGRFMGREAAEETPRPLERRKTGDRPEHGERSRKHHTHDDDERRRRKHRSVTLPVTIDPTDFKEKSPAPSGNGMLAPGPDSDPENHLSVPRERSSKHRKHRSSPNPMQFDVPSDGSGSNERKPSRSPGRDAEMPELRDVSGLGIDTGDGGEPKSHRRKHRRDRDYDDTPTPSPRKSRQSTKRPVKEVNFEDAVESGDAPKKEKSRRHHRSARDESLEEGDGSRERRRRERKRESGVFGGYGRE